MRPSSSVEIGSLSTSVPIAGKSTGGTGFPTFRKVVEELTYKPGYQLTLVVHEEATIDGIGMLPASYGIPATLHIKCYIPDSTRWPHELTLIQFQALIYPHVEEWDTARQLDYIKMILREFELHELDEWFKHQGKLVNDPHAKEKR